MSESERQYLDTMTGRGPFRRRAGQAQPNIIVISTDMVPLDFHCHPEIAGLRTPNIDALCALRFTLAFATSPLCSPSRAAYMTGRHSYITTNGERAHDGHAIHLRSDDVIFPEYLKATGYHTRHVGKCHVGAAKFIDVFGENDAPWDRWSPPWHDDDTYAAFLKCRGLKRFDFEREIVGRGLTGDQTQGRAGNSYGGWIAPQAGAPFPAGATYPAFLAEKAIDAIDARDPKAPLYLQLDFFGPHQPFAIPGGMEEREAEIRSAMTLPDSYAGAFETSDGRNEPRVYEIYRRNWGLQDEETVIDYRVANQLQYELIDQMIGRVLEHLKQQGLYEEAWIFFLGDHGEMNGEAGLVDKGAYLHPRVVRAPLGCKTGIAPGATVGPRDQVVEQPVSLLDLAPTILEVAGITPEARLDGQSLLSAAAGEARDEDRPIMFEVWSHVIPNPCVGTILAADRAQPHLFAFNACDPVDELYDLSDPGLPVNLALLDEELKAAAVRTLHGRLAADERWKGYRGFLEISYPGVLQAGGDRQLFV